MQISFFARIFYKLKIQVGGNTRVYTPSLRAKIQSVLPSDVAASANVAQPSSARGSILTALVANSKLFSCFSLSSDATAAASRSASALSSEGAQTADASAGAAPERTRNRASSSRAFQNVGVT
jgi:hypothetical protein